MKCLKCGADAPPNLSSSLCAACLDLQRSKGGFGCLYLTLGFIAIVVVFVILFETLGNVVGFLVMFAGAVAVIIWLGMRTPKMSSTQLSQLEYGSVNGQIICPHCQTKGKVRTKRIQKDAGISGKKATAAALTGGISLLATGLSRKETVTQAHCDNCNSTWTY